MLPRKKNLQRDFNDLYVYDEVNDESPFITFLEYTNEKDKISDVISGLLFNQIRHTGHKIKILDIGCGDASLMSMSIEKSGLLEHVDYEGIEPVDFNCNKARNNMKKLGIDNTIICKQYENYYPTKNYDFIVASNLYHMSVEDVPLFLESVQSILSNNGAGYYIYRKDDEVVNFRKQFEAPLYDNFRGPRTINDIIVQLNKYSVRYDYLKDIAAEVYFPDNKRIKNKILEFILNINIDDIDQDYLSNIYSFLYEHNNKLNIEQGVLRITK